jgi:hypothetical protein
MLSRLVILFLPLAILAGCQTNTDSTSAEVSADSDPMSQGEAWIEKAVAAHGSEALKNAEISFDFRGKDFFVQKDGHDYYYQREYLDSTGARVIDQVWPDSMFRTIDGKRPLLTPKKRDAIKESIHSVVYFALLPQALQDPAVQASYVDEMRVLGKPYHRVKVTFSEENGGTDYQDEYMYWIHDESNTIDYLAYNFQVNGGGARFRAVIQDTLVANVRFQDYKNYKPLTDRKALLGLDNLYEKGELELLSTIALNDLEVAIVKE